MNYKAKSLGNLKGLGEVFESVASLNDQVRSFFEEGISAPYLASPDEVAQIRLAGLSSDCSRTSIAPIAIKNGKTILVRDSPILLIPYLTNSAVKAHENEKFFTMGKEIYESAEALANSQTSIEPEERDAIIVSNERGFGLVPEMDETRFILRKQNEPYFKKKVRVGEIFFHNLLGESKDESTVGYLWFDGLPSSNFSCECKGFIHMSRAFAVLRTDGNYIQRDVKNAKAELDRLSKILQPDQLLSLSGLLQKIR